MNTSTPVRSPVWWVNQLSLRLMARVSQTRKFQDYYDGRQPLTFVTSKYREEFGKMLAAVSDNWMALVVDAVEERLHVEGFRIDDQVEGDSAAWDIWQRNFLDSDSELVHNSALVLGEAGVLVWYDQETDGPEITVESALQVLVAHTSGSRRKRDAAIKMWLDDWTGTLFANIYLPDVVYKYQTRVATNSDPWTSEGDAYRDQFANYGTTSFGWNAIGVEPNPLGVVPIVPMINRPQMLGRGRSEIVEVTSTQDQINKIVADMIVASEFGAFRQRWATGVEIPTDPEGKELEPFKSAIDRLWHVPAPDATFGDFAQTDLSNYVKAIENRVQSLASRSRTPPHYLLGQSGTFPSGESLKATETGLIAKAKSRMRHFGEGWEEVIRLAFSVTDDPRAAAASAETIWRDPESRTEGEHVDALLKKLALGVPLQQLWADAGYSPSQIDRFLVMFADQKLKGLLQAAPVPPVAAAKDAQAAASQPASATADDTTAPPLPAPSNGRVPAMAGT